jgi:hypothetical protein
MHLCTFQQVFPKEPVGKFAVVNVPAISIARSGARSFDIGAAADIFAAHPTTIRSFWGEKLNAKLIFGRNLRQIRRQHSKNMQKSVVGVMVAITALTKRYAAA